MTLKEINELTMEAYRRGYNDAMSDRAAQPDAPTAPAAASSAPLPESIEAFNLAMANFLDYSGAAQPPVDETLRRTRA